MKQNLIPLGALALLAASALSGVSATPRARAGHDTGSERGAAAAASKEAAPPAGGGVVLGKLANPTLPTGGCGMLIWMLEGDAPTPVFRYVSGAAAQISVAGKTLELARIETDGVSNFGVFEKQKFTSGAGATVEITIEFGAPFEGGAWLQNGLIAIDSEDGWRSVAPVAGVAGCRAK